jgi:DNA-binding HxlR family transcriptional regulator
MPRPTKQQQLETLMAHPGQKFPGTEKCAMRTSLNVISGKWKLLALSYILEQPRRYGELRRLVPEATEKMLIQVLRELEQDEIIARKQFAEVPPRVEYSPTEQGLLLRPVVRALLQWGSNYMQYKDGKRKSGRKVA